MTVDPLAEPRRIALIGDWHANAFYGPGAIRYAKQQGADVIVHLGDYGYTFPKPFMTAVGDALDETGLQLLFVEGNHDSPRFLEKHPIGAAALRQVGERVWHLPRGFRWTWAGVHFLALGGAHSVDRPWRTAGVSWWPEETVTEEQAAHAISGGPADVLIAHDCPSGVNIPGLQPDLFPPLEILRAEEHRQVLRRVVDAVQPRTIWHGHYHQRYEQTVDFSYGPLQVTGLDCDGSALEANVQVVELADVAAAVRGENGVPASDERRRP